MSTGFLNGKACIMRCIVKLGLAAMICSPSRSASLPVSSRLVTNDSARPATRGFRRISSPSCHGSCDPTYHCQSPIFRQSGTGSRVGFMHQDSPYSRQSQADNDGEEDTVDDDDCQSGKHGQRRAAFLCRDRNGRACCNNDRRIDGRADILSTGCHPFPDCCVSTI